MPSTPSTPSEPPAPSPDGLHDLSRWITREATVTVDPGVILPEIGRRLLQAAVPVSRINIAVATLSAVHRGLSITWQPGDETRIVATDHGAEGEISFGRSPIAALLAEDRRWGRWRTEAGEGCERFSLLADLAREGVTDYLVDIVGFPPDTAIRGVGLSYATNRPGGFTAADVASIAGHRDALGLAVLRLSLSRTLRELLGTYVGERTARRVVAGEVRRGRGEIMAAAILLVDLKGFTAVADGEDPLRLVGWLDEHLDALGTAVDGNGGEILKFTGDGFIAVFPVAEGEAEARPCRACDGALAAARAGLALNRSLEARRRLAGEPALAADLALHFGQVVYGNIGTARRLDFTAIGRAVNEASRIETLCDATGRHILLSDSFARRCSAGPIDLGLYPLRGVATPQRLWTVPES